MKYQGNPNFSHKQHDKIGILITNLGTPDAPKKGDLKKMLAEIYGKYAGCCGGRGGSMHLFDKSPAISNNKFVKINYYYSGCLCVSEILINLIIWLSRYLKKINVLGARRGL